MTANITTHILDLDSGRPAAGVPVSLWRDQHKLASARTDADGRVKAWAPAFELGAGQYRLRFELADWFAGRGRSGFFPQVDITFSVLDETEHYHVPLLLNAHGYTTYRGS